MIEFIIGVSIAVITWYIFRKRHASDSNIIRKRIYYDNIGRPYFMKPVVHICR